MYKQELGGITMDSDEAAIAAQAAKWRAAGLSFGGSGADLIAPER